MNNDRRREVLAAYLDQRVVITGVFERMAVNKNPHKQFKVALLQDVEVELSKSRYDLGHVWIQHAETFADLNYGDRLQCSCRVGKYKRHVPGGENGEAERIDYSLSWPSEVRVLSRPIALSHAHELPPTAGTIGPTTFSESAAAPSPAPPPPPSPPPPAEELPRATDLVQLLLQVKELVTEVGGSERIQELKAIIDQIGGWERAVAIMSMAEEVGGWERFEQLLTLIKI